MISAVIGPGVVLQIGEALEEAEEYLQIFRIWFLILLFIVMILSSIIGWFMAKRALLDMEDVTETASEISKGFYDKRVRIKDRFEEIGRLGGTFNSMLDRIEKLLKSMREVNANIAHDLRSPLTSIRGIAEMSLMNERSVDEYKNMAASTIEECDRLIDMINTILEITEVEAGIREPRLEDLDVVRLIRDACELFRPIANEKSIRITEDIPDQLSFRGDRKNLQRIISNLLDNAIKYTPEGGSVSISLRAEEKRINIFFEDTGIGISETELPHIFERFYRCDRSRSRGGVGLGLSMVKAFTEAMKGSIDVMSTVNKGSRFSVVFPQ
jgi:signal transduction histidine kinase